MNREMIKPNRQEKAREIFEKIKTPEELLAFMKDNIKSLKKQASHFIARKLQRSH